MLEDASSECQSVWPWKFHQNQSLVPITAAMSVSPSGRCTIASRWDPANATSSLGQTALRTASQKAQTRSQDAQPHAQTSATAWASSRNPTPRPAPLVNDARHPGPSGSDTILEGVEKTVRIRARRYWEMEPVFGNYTRAEAFEVSDAPLLVVDTDLVIRDVNTAYLKATARTSSDLIGTDVFEAFPDNPDDPLATGVANVSASFERVFRDARRDHLPLQRYDIPSGNARGKFVRKFWSAVNTQLRDSTGHILGALHHAEDVTAMVDFMADVGTSSPAGLNMDQQTWTSIVTAVAREELGHRRARQTADQLQYALTSRIVIEQAKGMIAAREGIDINQACARLREYARRHNALVRDVASAVVDLKLSV